MPAKAWAKKLCAMLKARRLDDALDDLRKRGGDAEERRKWGPLYLVAYAGLATTQGYHGSLFERQARAAEAVCDE